MTVSIRHQDPVQSATLWWLHPQCEIQLRLKKTGALAVGFKFMMHALLSLVFSESLLSKSIHYTVS